VRRQLALLVAATTTLVLIAFLIPLALLVRTLAEDRAVAAAVQEAQALAVVAAVVTDPAQLEPLVQLADQRSERAVSVVLPGGRVLGSGGKGSTGAAQAAQDRARSVAASGRSVVIEVAGDREVLVPASSSAGRLVVRSVVPETQLRRGVLVATAALVGLGLGLLVVSMLVAARLARSVVRPVTALASAAHDLAAGNLDARVEPDGPPEVQEVGRAVNRLGTRVTELLAAERETVADLSHRLRTPLTALRLEAESLRDRSESAAVSAGVDALERTVDDVIRAARRPLREGPHATCDAAAVVRECAAFWTPLAEDQQRLLTVASSPEPLVVPLLAEDLAAALDALLGNAISHTAEGTPVDVSAHAESGSAVVEVLDRGPGLSPGALQRGASGAGSTGLGLDIARRTAEAAGGRLELGTRPAGGARVALHLPLVG
jgi:signal transduction histidine kinase